MVSEQAPTVNWIWDKDVSLQSSNVQGVIDEANGIWDWAHTSLK
jgi:hypothetical protein